jgi:uncharacterized protein (TIGR02145 family)
MKKINAPCFYTLLITIVFLFTDCQTNNGNNLVKDIDGNVYQTFTIGNKLWMAQNLRVTRYRNGDLIPRVPDPASWSTCTTGAYCHYNNDTSHVAAYGNLYNWYAINDSRNIAPEGWHIPTDEEIAALVALLETDPTSARTLKANGLAGYRYARGGTFHTMGFNGYWWSATRSYEIYDWSPRLFTGFADVQRNDYEARYGLAVRCVKDE